MVWVTLIALPQSSVTEYVRVMTSGQVLPSETSPTNATVGAAVQLSASSVTTEISEAGTSSAWTLDRNGSRVAGGWVCGVVDGDCLGNVESHCRNHPLQSTVRVMIRHHWTSIAVRNIAHIESHHRAGDAAVQLSASSVTTETSEALGTSATVHWTVTAQNTQGLLAVGSSVYRQW
jgi:hypothetical protein